MVDLVGLKMTNDTLGHQAGDERLKRLAVGVAEVVRKQDAAYRIGGDEFALLLPGLSAWEGFNVAERLQHALSGGFRGVAPAISIGVAESEPGIHKDELVRRADAALVSAKRAHRKTVVWTESLNELAPAGPTMMLPPEYTRTLATALARAVDAKDSYTRSHCETVSELCVRTASGLGLPSERVEKLRLAGLLHDVGKIGVPDAVLQKPAPLDDDEFELMKAHSTLGHTIVSGAGLDQEAEWVRHHHERPDGSGYPDGLSGDDIPLESRIILVADAYEAITSDRPYRKGGSQADALAELRAYAGSQFDPACVEALASALGERPAPLPTPAG